MDWQTEWTVSEALSMGMNKGTGVVSVFVTVEIERGSWKNRKERCQEDFDINFYFKDHFGLENWNDENQDPDTIACPYRPSSVRSRRQGHRA
jgi:hypothetical protein